MAETAELRARAAMLVEDGRSPTPGRTARGRHHAGARDGPFPPTVRRLDRKLADDAEPWHGISRRCNAALPILELSRQVAAGRVGISPRLVERSASQRTEFSSPVGALRNWRPEPGPRPRRRAAARHGRDGYRAAEVPARRSSRSKSPFMVLRAERLRCTLRDFRNTRQASRTQPIAGVFRGRRNSARHGEVQMASLPDLLEREPHAAEQAIVEHRPRPACVAGHPGRVPRYSAVFSPTIRRQLNSCIPLVRSSRFSTPRSWCSSKAMRPTASATQNSLSAT